ncbi:hypothetical protein FSPOR_11260 [Fusarium sporotrichioides]|uniref:Uncharacterized protein n=1 Tax=Fusarium sporotrichioides TaxID=5514 RepID=A0A395RHJ6_FUSSP|nr:hypothetical protein FSPOR_11260 [Fusarium sporotrichioides]
MLAASRKWAVCVLLLLSLVISQANALAISATNSSVTSTRSTGEPSTITAAPGVTEPFQVNTCSYYNATESRTLWDNPWCSMYVGTVDLVFWPTTGNHSYPSTYRDTISDYTFTSPSVYMIVNTMYAENPCGPLGPSATREIFAFDLTEVSTLVPYTDDVANTRRATRQLHLSDLDTHCTRSFNRSELATQTRPIKDDDTRCNPFLAVPKKFKEYGYPYWVHCGIKNNKFGVFDPPYAIPALDELIPAHTTSAEKPDTEIPTAIPSATAKPPPSAGSLETANASQHNTSPATGDPRDNEPSANPDNPQPTVVSTANTKRPSSHQSGDGLIASSVGTVASDGVDASQATLSDSNDAKPTPVDPVNTIVVENPGGNNAEASDSSIPSKPTLGQPDDAVPTPVGRMDTEVVDGLGHSQASAQKGGPQDTVGHHGDTGAIPTASENVEHLGSGEPSQSDVDTYDKSAIPTATFDGMASTVTKQVVSLGTDGLEVVNNETGETSTYAVPAAGASPSDGGLVPASVAVYNGHTLEQGGPAVTVTNAIVMTPNPASPTEDLVESSSTLSAVASSPANQVTQGTYGIFLAVLVYGWMYL